MSSDFRTSVAALFSEAIGLPEGERTAFLERVCSGNERLRSELESLLDADSRAGGFLQDDAAQVLGLAPSDDPVDVNAGRRIGAYRIVEPIGRGGMGTVYRAERVDAAYRVQVAIKLIRRGMDTDDILRRFRRERQVLARLQHPNIARLIDGGSLEDGLPYIVMEYVEGIAIDRFCDGRGLGIRERIQLFRSVCGAVEYAHGQLIVHRDLKPSNILVDNQGQARLLDFGIAKLLGGEDDETDAPEPTIPSLRLLTPHYSSPEQIHGRPVTTATDVYSLGVVLYRLLTGRVPFAQRDRSPDALGRSVRAEEAIRPSVASRGDPVLVRVEGGEQRLKRRLAGDLDTIILTALSSEAEHRYHSVHEFSEDLRRHLENLPIQAGRPTLRYRVSRFARRHRASLAAGAAVVSTLAVATALSTSLYLQARSARDEAHRQNEVAVEVSRFLGQTFAAVDPHVAQGRDVSVLRELLDGAAGRIANDITPGTEVAAALHLTLGNTYRSLAEYGKAAEHLEEAQAILDRIGRPDPRRVAEAHRALGALYRETGRYQEAGPHLVRALALMDSAGVGDVESQAAALSELGMTAEALGDEEAAEGHYRTALALIDGAFGADHRLAAAKRSDLAALLMNHRTDLAEPERLLQEAIGAWRSSHDRIDSLSLATGLHNMGGLLRRQKKYDDAEACYTEALRIQRRVLGPRHPAVAVTCNNVGTLCELQQDWSGAEQSYREALSIQRDVLGAGHRDVGTTLNNLGGLLRKTGRYPEGEAAFREAVEIYKASLGPRHAWVAIALTNLAVLLEVAEHWDGLRVVTDEALPIARENWTDDHWRTQALASLHGVCLGKAGRWIEAEAELRSSRERLAALLGPDDHLTREADRRLTMLPPAAGRAPDGG